MITRSGSWLRDGVGSLACWGRGARRGILQWETAAGFVLSYGLDRSGHRKQGGKSGHCFDKGVPATRIVTYRCTLLTRRGPRHLLQHGPVFCHRKLLKLRYGNALGIPVPYIVNPIAKA